MMTNDQRAALARRWKSSYLSIANQQVGANHLYLGAKHEDQNQGSKRWRGWGRWDRPLILTSLLSLQSLILLGGEGLDHP
jgi:hypothetical protein